MLAQLPAAGRGAVGSVSRGSKRPAELPNELHDLWTRAPQPPCLFKREGLPVEVLDELHWRIMPALIQPLAPDRGYLFWPATIGDAPTAAMEAVGPGS